MKNGLYFICGLILGVTLMLLYSRRDANSSPYFVLESDYKIEGAGYLQKGTLIKFDAGMNEGFDRFILYLNIKGGDLKRIDSLNGIICPYWLNKDIN